MKSFLANWKTTLGGVASICTGVAAIIHAVTVSPIDPNAIYAGIGLITTGAGLLFAKDGNVTGGSVKQ